MLDLFTKYQYIQNSFALLTSFQSVKEMVYILKISVKIFSATVGSDMILRKKFILLTSARRGCELKRTVDV